jgi:hypothetical protein
MNRLSLRGRELAKVLPPPLSLMSHYTDDRENRMLGTCDWENRLLDADEPVEFETSGTLPIILEESCGIYLC